LLIAIICNAVAFLDAPDRLVGLSGFERRRELSLCKQCGRTENESLFIFVNVIIYTICIQVKACVYVCVCVRVCANVYVNAMWSWMCSAMCNLFLGGVLCTSGLYNGRVPLAHGAIAHQPDSTRKIDTIPDSAPTR